MRRPVIQSGSPSPSRVISDRASGSPDEPVLIRRCRQATEAVLLSMACLAPWAFGAVEAWAEMILAVGVALLAALGVVVGWGVDRTRSLLCAPSVALAGLALLALGQTTPLSPRVLRWVAPATADLRARLIPGAPERVSGDPGPPVPLPPATLSLDPEASLQMSARLASAWIVFQSVLVLGGGFAPFRRFAVVITANATLLALFSLVQLLTWNGKVYWYRESLSGSSAGPFLCHNHLAAYLNMGLGLALGFLLAPAWHDEHRDRRGSRLWAAYAAGLIAVGVIASLSRSGFLSLSVALVAASVFLRPRKVHLLAGLAVALALIPVFLFTLGGSIPYQQRLTTLLDSGPYAERLQIWRDAFRAFPLHPFWGTGLGSFAVATVRFYRRDTGVLFVHAENEYVEWLVEGGVLGFALALVAVVGVARLGRRALGAAPSARERAIIWGALIACVTLLIQSLADFAMRIPGVTVTAVLLCAHLARLGLDSEISHPTPVTGGARGTRSLLPGLGICLLGVLLLCHCYTLARAEAPLDYADVSVLGTDPVLQPDGPDPELVMAKLEEALWHRPNWGEGHLRLGLLYLTLYERSADEALRARVPDVRARAVLADPLWLYTRVHSAPGDAPVTVEELLAFDHVRLNLVPAARSFLEARRCSPLLPLPHARLAALNFLLQGGDKAGVYLDRAFHLSGADGRRLALVTRAAVHIGDLELAARCWRKALVVSAWPWTDIADAARDVLPPAMIRDQVVPDGRYALWFGDRIYSAPEDRAIRQQFLRDAARRLPEDTGLTRAERLRLEAQAWVGLNDTIRARERMKAALALEPQRADWRKELIGWLISWGRSQEAHDEALVALHYTPGHPDARRALEMAADALARGGSDPRTPISP